MALVSLESRLSVGGAGIPVTFIHGFPLDGRMWAPQESVDWGRPVLIPDLAGFGASPWPEGGASIEDQARMVAGTLDERGVERTVLCGFSMGGYAALAAAALFPGRVAALVLVDTRAAADGAETKAAREQTAARILKEGTGFLVSDMLGKVLCRKTLDENGALVSRVRAIMAAQKPDAMAGALLAMRDRPSREEDLGRLACPVLVIVGAEDSITPPAEARAMAGMAVDGNLVEISGAGHLSSMEAPEEVNAALMTFLKRLSG